MVSWHGLVGVSSFAGSAPGDVDSLRFVVCGRLECQQCFFICARCDRGDRYCSTVCREAARVQSLRQAGRKYQASRDGRFAHAARQQRQREKVTHQGPPKLAFPIQVVLPLTTGGKEDSDGRPDLCGNSTARIGDESAGDGGGRLDAAESEAGGAALASESIAEPARGAGTVAESAGPRCARCGQRGRYVRHESVSRSRRRARAHTALHAGCGRGPPASPAAA